MLNKLKIMENDYIEVKERERIFIIMKKEENVKVNIDYTRFKVASYALARVIKALNNCGIYDITVTKEDSNLVVVFDEFEPFRPSKPDNLNDTSVCSGTGNYNGYKH